MKRVARVALAILTFCAVGFVFVGAPDAEAAPTVINTVADLQNIQSNLFGDYVLGSDIDASGFAFTPIGDPSPTGKAFSGRLDGQGHTITGLTISASPSIFIYALFRGIEAGGTVENLRLSNVSITAPHDTSAAGLAGYNWGVVRNVSVTGTITGGGVGGLIAGNAGTIMESQADVSVHGSENQYTGGLVGANSGVISNSSATGSVNGIGLCGVGFCQLAVVGGLVGANGPPGSITDSYATGTVNGTNAAILGGLVGTNGIATIARSFATGAVSGAGEIVQGGGFVGFNESATITQSYSTGNVSGVALGLGSGYADNIIGGFVGGTALAGNIIGTISESYSAGRVSGTASGVGFLSNSVGGFMGVASFTVGNNSYWDTQTSGTTLAAGSGFFAGVSGATTAQLTSGILPIGFDPSVWTAAPGQYPRLKWQDEFLSFPLRGLTSETAVINSVMDHSVPIDTAGVHFYDDAGTTDVITAFTGEQGLKNCGVPHCSSPVGSKGLAGYKQSSGGAFFVNGNYSGGLYLFYQGHSGYDFSAAMGTEILAPADGVAFIPNADPIVSKNAVDAITRFNILAVDHLNGYVTWYMHLGDNNSDFRRIKCPPDAAEVLIQPNQFIPVTRGCRIGFVGYKGLNGPKDAHLHFEVRRGVTTDPVSKVRTCARPTCFPVDPYGWEPLSNAPVQSDPYSIYPNGARLWFE